jgi:DNA-binding HxlR family transcriptional regulator
MWVRREVFDQARQKAKSDLLELENELMSVIVAMEAAYGESPTEQWDEVGVGGWVRREVLEKVKIKAKQDLVDLESELLSVILSMEAEAAVAAPTQTTPTIIDPAHQGASEPMTLRNKCADEDTSYSFASAPSVCDSSICSQAITDLHIPCAFVLSPDGANRSAAAANGTGA